MGASSSAALVSVDVSAGSCAQSQRWWAGVALGGKLYGVPCNAEQLLVYDPASSSGASFVNTRKVATGDGKWRSAVALGGKIYGIPDRAEQILVYDLATGQASAVDTRKVSRGPLKWQSAAVLGGKVYGVPHHASKLLVYDPKTGLAQGVDVSHVAAGSSKWMASVVLGGKLFGIPCNADTLLIYDPVNSRCSGVDVKHVATGPLKWLAAVTLAGRLYAVPCHADCILVYDPCTGLASSIDTRSVATGPGKWLSAVVCGGKIIGIPDHAECLLVFDPKTQEVSGVDTSSLASGPFKWQAATVIAGRIYAVPYHAEQILVFDPSSGLLTGLETSSSGSSGQGKWGAAAAIGGKLFGLPFNANTLLMHQPVAEPQASVLRQTTTEAIQDADGESSDVAADALPRSDSELGAASAEPGPAKATVPDLRMELGQELVEDFLALWLSEWIYEDSAPVLDVLVDGDPVEFLVHHVLDDPLQGSPARLAVVTAKLPAGAGSTVFLVFKGSSFWSECVVNASVSPDYSPFDAALLDRTTFIHHGAHHAIAQLRIHQWAVLVEQLSSAWDEGTRRVVVAGHSLGGQYALAFMLQVFLDQVGSKPEPPPFMRAVRCVAFGSPMCYGSSEGVDVRQ
ncbi:unnamed protein product, partial [Polarella glacialis]